MKVTGIIVEYNPFHNGHLYHLDETRKTTKADCIIAVMSGNFVQRGEPAFLDKWYRTEMALTAGIDLVIELPLLYSISSAEGFAFGAVSILNKLGIVNSLCFGSESGDIDDLIKVSEILAMEPDEYRNLLREYLDMGLSFPAAREKAVIQYSINKSTMNMAPEAIGEIVSNSNNILAIEYIKSLIKLGSSIKPFTIGRVNNKYNEIELTGSISSATAIRNNFSNRDVIKNSLPSYVMEIINKAMEEGRGPLSINDFSQLILYKLRTLAPEEIRNFIDVSEGLEYKIKQAADESADVYEIIDKVKNKRFTSTRIQRILMYALLNITKDLQPRIKLSPEYIRVLGFSPNGRRMLKEIKNHCDLPIITNPSIRDLELLKYDILSTDIYSLGFKSHLHRSSKQDLKKCPIILTDKP